MFKFLYTILCLLAVFAATSCREDASQTASNIYPVKFGESYLYIPKEYIQFGDTGIETNSALLRAWYPGSAIVPGRIEGLWEEGEYWKSVRVLIDYIILKQSFDDFSKKSTRIFDATEVVGEEYGLLHMTQPKGKVKDKADIWYEKHSFETISYITCSEQILTTDKPQCSHSFFIGPDLVLTVHYDKKLLPEWKKIQGNIEGMIQSFSTPESSKKFILERIQDKKKH